MRPVHDGLVAPLPVFDRPGRSVLPLARDQIAAVRALNELICSGALPLETVPCVCGGTRFAEVARTDRYGILQTTAICRRCGLIQSNPRFTETAHRWFYESDEYRRIYDGGAFARADDAQYAHGRGDDVFARVTAARPLSQIGTLLEFGAGGGWNLVRFVEAGIDVVGYDYSPGLVALGRSRGIELLRGGADDVEGAYDVIVLNHVIEHFTDVVETLRTLRSHLAGDGVMVVEVPDIENFHVGQLQNAHTYYFTARTLAFCVGAAGLAVVDRRREPNGHMSAVLAASSAPPPDVTTLAGHFDEMTALIRRYARVYRLRTPVRLAGGALGAVGLKEPARGLLSRAWPSRDPRHARL